MRTATLICVIVTAASLNVAGQKDAPPTSSGKKGDKITVRGCLTGTALEATDLGTTDATSVLATGVTFRLTGDKKLLKQLRDEHDGKLVDVEGVLKSDLPNQGIAGRKVGKMRVTIGAPAASPASPEAEARRAVPILEVKSYESAGTRCGRT